MGPTPCSFERQRLGDNQFASFFELTANLPLFSEFTAVVPYFFGGETIATKQFLNLQFLKK